MTIVGSGIDLVAIKRFKRFIDEEKTLLLERLFTPDELSYAGTKKSAASHLAARFAAKEAFVKALGTGLRMGLSWQQIEVVLDPLGCPSLVLTGRAASMMTDQGASASHLSYSHDGEYAVASVILEA